MPLFEFLEDYRYTFAQTKIIQASMRKVYLLVLFMMCIAASFPVYAKMLSTTCVEVITPVTMHKTNEDSSLNHKVPKRDPFELSCYLVGNANTIFLSANKVVSVEVEIENLTTGDYASYYDQISTTTLLLPLSGTSYYRISVTLSDGVNFYGEFDL
ncbi:unknown [Alistipes sp. CAG:435]|nr:unknown [Alistipes sp. CAG:435]